MHIVRGKLQNVQSPLPSPSPAVRPRPRRGAPIILPPLLLAPPTSVCQVAPHAQTTASDRSPPPLLAHGSSLHPRPPAPLTPPRKLWFSTPPLPHRLSSRIQVCSLPPSSLDLPNGSLATSPVGPWTAAVGSLPSLLCFLARVAECPSSAMGTPAHSLIARHGLQPSLVKIGRLPTRLQAWTNRGIDYGDM